MITDCSTKTVTEVEDYKVKISCFASENQNEVVDKPTLFQANILQKPTSINKTSGLEGELLLTHTDSGKIATIDKNGNMILQLNDDEVDKYSLNSEGELIYNG